MGREMESEKQKLRKARRALNRAMKDVMQDDPTVATIYDAAQEIVF